MSETVDEWIDHWKNGYSDDELQRAFDCVRDFDDWKNPIDVTVSPTVESVTRDQIVTAIVYFTGSVPTVTDLDDGAYRVQAEGYYMAMSG